MSRGSKKNVVKNGKIIPPDGGWGWMIVIAYALNNIVMIPLIYGMSLIFKDLFPMLGFTKKQESIIMSTNLAFGMGMGLTHGPLIKMFGYRKIALTGSILFSGGIFITAFATEFFHYIISYGIITSFGISLTMSSFTVAVNSYFSKKRGHAIGIASVFTGLGPIIMPQIIKLFMDIYTNQDTMIVLAAITLHCFLASLLLQPIKWHAKCQVDEPKDNELAERQFAVEEIVNPDPSLNKDVQNKDLKVIEITKDVKTKTEYLISARSYSVTSLPSKNYATDCSQSLIDAQEDESRTRKNRNKWWSSGKSLETVNLGSSAMIFEESLIYGSVPLNDSVTKIKENNENEVEEKIKKSFEPDPKNIAQNGLQEIEPKKKSKKGHHGLCNFWYRIVNIFDLNLLCDPIYVNMMLGTSIATFAEMNFSILTPFILKDMKFDTSRIATVMTVMAAIDLPMRGIGPFIGRWLKQTPRVMYLVSLVMLIGSRTMLIYCTSFSSVIIMAISLGFARGFRSVFMALIVPSYIPIERLAHATGIQMVINAIVLIVFGPIIGIIRQSRGSYGPCITLINSMTMLTIIMWTVEMLIVRKTQKQKNKKEYLPVNITSRS